MWRFRDSSDSSISLLVVHDFLLGKIISNVNFRHISLASRLERETDNDSKENEKRDGPGSMATRYRFDCCYLFILRYDLLHFQEAHYLIIFYMTCFV